MTKTAKVASPVPAMAAIVDNAPESAGGNLDALKIVEGMQSPDKAQREAAQGRAFDAAQVARDIVAMKATLRQTAKQQLAEAIDAEKEASDKASPLWARADELKSKAAFSLYQAKAAGLISNDELSGLLGDVYGYKVKENGDNSKTPAGDGEVIRKRVVRISQAHAFASGDSKDCGKMFDGLPVEAKGEVEAILLDVDAGELSVFTAYGKIADVAKKYRDEPNKAMNGNTIDAIVAGIEAEGAAEAIKADKELFDKYLVLAATMAASLGITIEAKDIES